jgi:hypothetical protein
MLVLALLKPAVKGIHGPDPELSCLGQTVIRVKMILLESFVYEIVGKT